MVPPVVSGSMTSFRMSYEIVPVCPAGMSRYIDPAARFWAGVPRGGRGTAWLTWRSRRLNGLIGGTRYGFTKVSSVMLLCCVKLI